MKGANRACLQYLLPLVYLLWSWSASADQRIEFRIAAERLPDALIEFARQSGLALFYDAQLARGQVNPPLFGQYNVQDALSVLLSHTRLISQQQSDGSVIIYARPTSAPQGSDEADPHPTIERIKVTAQRRSEFLQQVPISLSVLDATDMQETDSASVSSLSTRIPGLFVTNFSAGQPQIRVRGIGTSNDGPGNDIPVAFYVDDVYMGRMTDLNVALLDVEQVDVLRGPQTTLFGYNASAGAIQVSRKQPSDSFWAELGMETGSRNLQGINGIVSGPVSDTRWLGRMAFKHSEIDGYQHNLYTGKMQQGGSILAWRGSLQHQGELAKLTFNMDFADEDLDGTGRVPVGDTDTAKLFKAYGGDARHALNDVPGFSKRQVKGASLHIDWPLEQAHVTAISALRNGQFDFVEDLTGLNGEINSLAGVQGIIDSPVAELTNGVQDHYQQFSQEVRINSTGNSAASWVVGAVYLQQQVNRQEYFDYRVSLANEQDRENNNQHNKTHSYALYLDSETYLHPNWKLHAGARLAIDHKVNRQSVTDADIIFEHDYTSLARHTWQRVSPRLLISYLPSDEQLYYASLTRGYKSGAFRAHAANQALASTPLEPAILSNMEVGGKWSGSNWQFMANYYYSRYRNMQVYGFVDASQASEDIDTNFYGSNSASSHVKGIEAEGKLMLSRQLSLYGNYAWSRGRFNQYIDNDGNDFSGMKLLNYPETMYTLGIRGQHPVAAGQLTWRIEQFYQSTAFRTFQRDPNLAIRGFHRADAYLAYGQHQWKVALKAQNLFDTLYQIHTTVGNGGYHVYAPPRTITVSFTYQF